MTVIRAAGGVAWRRRAVGAVGPLGAVEVCVVHRPRYDDWSLPKGKLREGEHPLAAAVREVREETGVRGVPQCPLPPMRYRVDGVPKVVDYWSMRTLSEDRFVPGPEVDGLRWVPLPAALALVSYGHDVTVLRAFAALPVLTGVVLLVRHAAAGRRGSWPGPDAARPLDEAGVAHTARLAPLLALFAPDRLVSASPRRCVQTLRPLASALDLPVEIDTTFDENSDPATAAGRLRVLAAARPCTVVCSQGALVARVVGLVRGDGRSYPAEVGDGWVLPFTGDVAHTAAPLTA